MLIGGSGNRVATVYFLLVVIAVGECPACVIQSVVTCCSCLFCLQAMFKATEDDEDYTAFDCVSDLWIKQIYGLCNERDIHIYVQVVVLCQRAGLN